MYRLYKAMRDFVMVEKDCPKRVTIPTKTFNEMNKEGIVEVYLNDLNVELIVLDGNEGIEIE